MYIQQECIFSFEEIEKLQPQTKLQKIFAEVDFSNTAYAIESKHPVHGPKGHDVLHMLNALLAMQIEQIKTVKALTIRLKYDPVFRVSCGFDHFASTPSESTFSRLLSKISDLDKLEEEFKSLVLDAKRLNIIEALNVAVDSTKLNSFEAPKPKSKLKDDGISPNWGAKCDTNGNKIKWFGWKLHIIADCKSELPICILNTPASINDGDASIPLMEKFLKDYKGIFHPDHFIMDSGYDYEKVYDCVLNKAKALPIIAYNKRGSYAPPESMNENLHPVCSMGYELIYWGKDGEYLKFRCPHITGKVNCPHGSRWCSNSNYGYCLKVNYKTHIRLCGYPLRDTREWNLLYNQRTSIERCNSRLKVFLNTDNIRSAGINKAKTFCLLNCIALIAGTIAVNRVKMNLKVA